MLISVTEVLAHPCPTTDGTECGLVAEELSKPQSGWQLCAQTQSPPGSSLHGILQARILEWVSRSPHPA